MPKYWKEEEIALVCKAYIGSTTNSIVKTDQVFHAFSIDLFRQFEIISIPNCEERTYHKRGSRVYPYLRDNVFPTVQKLQKTLRMLYTPNSSSAPEGEKMNMEVSIHCEETKHMEYQYRTYNPNE